MSRMTRDYLKKEVSERMTKNLKLRGVQSADVTNLWDDNSDLLKSIFEKGAWKFVKSDGRIYLQND